MKYSDLDILFLTKEIPDYVHDAVYLGLSELGCNVVDFPRKPSLHGTRHPSIFHCPQTLFQLPINDLRKARPDLMIVTALMYDHNPLGTRGWFEHVWAVDDKYQPQRIIALDGCDKQEIHLPELSQPYTRIFKREMRPPYPLPQCRPFSMMPIPEPFVWRYARDRTLDFVYEVAPSCDYRSEAAVQLKNISRRHKLRCHIYCGAPVLPRSEYLTDMSRARCVISVRGMGWDTYRYWEIPAHGTVMVTQDVGLPIEHDFVDGVHCIRYTGQSDDALETAVLRVRDMSHAEIDAMAARAIEHVSIYHTPRVRAARMLDEVFESTDSTYGGHDK